MLKNASITSLHPNSNYTYQLIADYTYEGKDYTNVVLDEYQFTTSHWIVWPGTNIYNIVTNKDMVTFNLNFNEYHTVDELKVVLKQGNTIVSEIDSEFNMFGRNELSFSNLVQDTTYRIEVLAQYTNENGVTEESYLGENGEFTTDTWINEPSGVIKLNEVDENHVSLNSETDMVGTTVEEIEVMLLKDRD